MLDFLTFFSLAHGIVACSGMFFNMVLVFLAVFHTPRVLRSYTVLIINFALTDFNACFFDLFVQQRIIPVGKTLGYTSNGLCKIFGPDACYIGYSLMLHFLSHSLWSLLLSFSYRYYVLFQPSPSRSLLTLVLLFAYTPSLLQWTSFLFAQDDPEEIRAILHDRFPNYNLSDQFVTGTKDIFCFSALYTI